MVDEETAFQLSIHPFIDQFSRLYIQHESEHLDLRIELDDAKFYLEQAKIDKRLNDIVCDEKTRLFESKLGADFIGVVGHSPDDDPKIFDDVMDDLKNLDRVLNSHTFKIPKGLKLVCLIHKCISHSNESSHCMIFFSIHRMLFVLISISFQKSVISQLKLLMNKLSIMFEKL